MPSVAGAEAQNYLDLQGLESLKSAAGSSPHDPATLRAVAQQFEALMLGIMMKSMRDAKLGDGLLDNDQSRMYQELLDQQLSLTLSQGRGLGIADMLVRSLSPHGSAAEAMNSAYGKPPKRTAPAPAPATQPGQPPAATAAAFEAAPTPAAGNGGGMVAQTAADFVALVLPQAESAGAALNVDPLALVAQAAVESNWGRQVPHAADGSSFNVFGIKAGAEWSGRRTLKDTIEYVNGVAERRREPFRAYDSLAHGFADYVQLLSGNSRYAAALGQGRNGEAYLAALQRAGYATDPAYAQKVAAVLRSPALGEAVAGLKNVTETPIF
jgi:flagellar protein FlgJ